MLNILIQSFRSISTQLTEMKFDFLFTYESLFLLLAFILLLITYYGNKIIKNRKSPPGPWSLPIVGYLPWLGNRPHLTFLKLSEKYGNIFQIKLGKWNAIILNSDTTVKEVLEGKTSLQLSDHPNTYPHWFYNGHGITFESDGKDVIFRRNIVIKTIMSFLNSNNQNIHDIFLNTGEKLVTTFKKTNGEPYNPKDDINEAIGNVITSLIYGKHIFKNDIDLNIIINHIQQANELSGPGNILNFYPERITKFIKLMETIQKFPRSLINFFQNKNETITMNNVGYTIKETAKELNQNGLHHSLFTEDDLARLSSELITSGLISISSTLQWAILLMAKHPDIQKKVQNEIDSVIPYRCYTNLINNNNNNKNALTFTKATLLEIQRYSSVLSLGISRFTIDNVIIEGYQIPKDTIIIPNYWSAHRDPKIWDEPNKFNPERFLNSEGNKILNNKAEQLLSFGTGRRCCVGKLLARMELFVFFTILMQRFNFKSVPEKEIDLNNYCSGLFLSPNSFLVSIISRN